MFDWGFIFKHIFLGVVFFDTLNLKFHTIQLILAGLVACFSFSRHFDIFSLEIRGIYNNILFVFTQVQNNLSAEQVPASAWHGVFWRGMLYRVEFFVFLCELNNDDFYLLKVIGGGNWIRLNQSLLIFITVLYNPKTYHYILLSLISYWLTCTRVS